MSSAIDVINAAIAINDLITKSHILRLFLSFLLPIGLPPSFDIFIISYVYVYVNTFTNQNKFF